MKRGYAFKAWAYLLCASFLLLTSGLHTMISEAKDVGRPLGEMVSRGEVKFEAKKSVWKDVEPSQFLIFPGMRIKTEGGVSLINLEGNWQIEVGKNTLLSFDRNDEIKITKGAINFRLPATAELSFKVGELSVVQSKSPRASKDPSAVSPMGEATLGSISVRSNGAVTVKSLQGSLCVLDQKHVVLASLSSNETIILPSVMVKGASEVMVAQAGKKSNGPEPESGKFLGLSTWLWIAAGMALGVAVVAVVGITATSGDGSGGEGVPVCP